MRSLRTLQAALTVAMVIAARGVELVSVCVCVCMSATMIVAKFDPLARTSFERWSFDVSPVVSERDGSLRSRGDSSNKAASGSIASSDGRLISIFGDTLMMKMILR